MPLNQCASVDNCLFTENHCEVRTEGGKEPLLGELAARAINTSNNRLVGLRDIAALFLHPQNGEQAIVMGNTSTGLIVVQGGTPVPADIKLTNIFGI